jgi:hypothetical protein
MFGFGPKTCAVVTQQTWINNNKQTTFKHSLFFFFFFFFFLISSNKEKKVPDWISDCWIKKIYANIWLVHV